MPKKGNGVGSQGARDLLVQDADAELSKHAFQVIILVSQDFC